jgi:putative tryptophan/tyrosine transport system substrate-binding protein
MRRRDFIKGIVGSATAWPLMARAQRGEHMRRIGVLMNFGAGDPEAPVLVGSFSQGLAEADWIIGRNARIDYRWYQGNAETARAYAAELLALTPDIILASGSHGTMAVKQLTRTVPIVFVYVADPVVSGIVDSLARPAGNITGFMAIDSSFGGKWLDLLKEIAPHVGRVAVFRDDTNPAGIAPEEEGISARSGLFYNTLNRPHRAALRGTGGACLLLSPWSPSPICDPWMVRVLTPSFVSL